MLRAGGQITVELEDGEIREHDTFTCAHGNEIVRVAVGHIPTHWKDGAPIDHCFCCKQPLCQPCAAKMNRTLKCVPFMKKVELMERRQLFFKAVGV